MPEQPATPRGIPTYNPRHLLELYLAQNYEELSDRFLEVLHYFHNNTLLTLDQQARYFIDSFVKLFLDLFTMPDYRLADRHVLPFIRLNLTVANLAAISSFRSTDPYLEILRHQPANFAKILTLYSARNSAAFDRRAFFDAHVAAASLWYCMYGQIYRGGLIRPEVVANLLDHYTFEDSRLRAGHEIQELYFGSTYVDGSADRHIKKIVNRFVQGSTPSWSAGIRNRPERRKVAVVSALWYPGHSVYRTLSGYVESLKPDYHLTFVNLGAATPGDFLGLFDEVKTLTLQNGSLDIDPIRNNDFMAVYYPDVGMSPQSILLSNLRLAPVQLMGTGHPVSTWGSEIDYFVSGADVEIAERPEINYSERLVLLPGLGAIYNRPTYEPRGRQKTTERVVINCSWFAQKINHRFCKVLAELVRRSPRPILLRLFTGSALHRQNDFIPFAADVAALLGRDSAEIVTARPYADYMALMEEGDFSIDCYHFGGSNTVVDSLHLGKPVVTWEYDKWYGRIGSALMRRAGAGELAAANEDQYLETILKLIQDEDYRAAMTDKIRGADLDRTVFSMDDGRYFKKALDHLIANHDRLRNDRDRAAIRIER